MSKIVVRTGIVLAVVLALLVGVMPRASLAGEIQWGKIDPALQALMAGDPGGTFAIIVEGAQTNGEVRSSAVRATDVGQRLKDKKGKLKATLGIIGAVSATGDYASIAELSQDPKVARIVYDAPLRGAVDPVSVGNVYQEVIRAGATWSLGYTGKGVGVAVLDSGINAGGDLTLPTNRVVARASFVNETVASLDPGGHGTHVAGIIGGNGVSAPPEAVRTWQGVAPDVRLIDVQVIDSTGNTNLSTVIRGVQWAIQNRSTYNIRVMNLSLGATVSSSYTYRTDPLVAALNVAWLSGMVVVVAAGNTGSGVGTINAPATDPMAIAVGALDDGGTGGTTDDSVAVFSSRGPTPDGYTKPDLVAPGRRIISGRSMGSTLDVLLPERVISTTVGSTYFRLSGTSMAAPVVAGVVALLLEKNPTLKPDQIKAILTRTSRPLSGYDANTAGAGVVDAYGAVTSGLVERANGKKRPADSFARAILPLIKGQPLSWRDASYAGRNWANVTWDNITWDNITWDNLVWENIAWDNITWDNLTWDNMTWDMSWSSIQQDSFPWLSSQLE